MGFTWGVCSSRLTLKRQKARREEGRPHVSDLGMIIRETQRDAAALSAGDLRREIQIHLQVQDAAIRLYYATMQPGAGNLTDRIVAADTVMVSMLMTALYVAELATRPAELTPVVTSLN